jgi:hypothetical protein
VLTKIRPNLLLAGLAITLSLGAAACGPSSGSSAATGGNSGSAATGAESTGGEAAAQRYVDARYHYQIDAPGHLTAGADGTAAFVGPSERLQVAVIQGTRAADVGALARQDIAGLPVTSPGFHLLSGPTSISLAGHRVEKFTYSWDSGTSQVTGKSVALVQARYYVSKDAATVAVISYGIVSNQYDPQGADDLAGTFQWQ